MSTPQNRIVIGESQIIYGTENYSQVKPNQKHSVSFQWPFADDDVCVSITLQDPGYGYDDPTTGVGTGETGSTEFEALIKSTKPGFSSSFSWIAFGKNKAS